MKLKATFETEVYISEVGYIAIRQPGQHGDEEAIVLLSAEQARLVAEELSNLASDPNGWSEIDSNG